MIMVITQLIIKGINKWSGGSNLTMFKSSHKGQVSSPQIRGLLNDFSRLLYINVRGLNNKLKQGELIKWLSRDESIDIAMMSETKLTKSFKIPGWREIQTTFARNGGCWTACKQSEKIKRIKYMDTSLSWMSCAYSNVPVH